MMIDNDGDYSLPLLRARDVPDVRDSLVADFANVECSSPRQREAQQWTVETLPVAALWFCAPDLCGLVEGAAATVPAETVLDASLLLDETGLLVFGRDVSLAEQLPPKPGISLSAIMWGPSPYRSGVAMASWHRWRQIRDPTARWAGYPAVDWSFGEPLDTSAFVDGHGEAEMLVRARRRLVLTVWALATQPNLARQSVERPSRQAARREQRAGREPSTVKVVDLRAPARSGGDSTRDDVAWSHRWLVDGHWRLQPYGPGRTKRRPAYVDQYVKGPADKPLIVKPTVKVLR